MDTNTKKNNSSGLASGQVTVILTVWKRSNILEQLQALFNQTEQPYQIWICHYENHVNLDEVKEKYPEIIILSCQNLKYFGRFAFAQFVKSEYVWILDDDIIPAANWLNNSRIKCESEHAIISGAGRIIPDGDYFPERMINVSNYFIGDMTPYLSYNFCQKDTTVDFGCNGWLFRSEWIKTFWQIPPYTLEMAEDIHLSAVCKLKLGISTIVPKQIDKQTSGNLKIMYGRDEFASWRKSDFLESREQVIRYLIDQHGWQPLRWNSQTNRGVNSVDK